MANALNVIYPYKYEGMWVFDDEKVGLDKEPFVEGADTMIDHVLAMKGLQNLEAGFRLVFSAGEFPRYDVKFDWAREVKVATGTNQRNSKWKVGYALHCLSILMKHPSRFMRVLKKRPHKRVAGGL